MRRHLRAAQAVGKDADGVHAQEQDQSGNQCAHASPRRDKMAIGGGIADAPHPSSYRADFTHDPFRRCRPLWQRQVRPPRRGRQPVDRTRPVRRELLVARAGAPGLPAFAAPACTHRVARRRRGARAARRAGRRHRRGARRRGGETAAAVGRLQASRRWRNRGAAAARAGGRRRALRRRGRGGGRRRDSRTGEGRRRGDRHPLRRAAHGRDHRRRTGRRRAAGVAGRHRQPRLRGAPRRRGEERRWPSRRPRTWSSSTSSTSAWRPARSSRGPRWRASTRRPDASRCASAARRRPACATNSPGTCWASRRSRSASWSATLAAASA